MKYLVLQNFRSFGRRLTKGEVVDEADIRSPRLRLGEGKIIPAVSSQGAHGQSNVAADNAACAPTSGNDDTPGVVKHFTKLVYNKG